MRLCTVMTSGGPRAGVQRDGEPLVLDAPAADLGALCGLDPAELAALAHRATPAGEGARLLAPLPRPGKIVAIGLNYADHVREIGMDTPGEPLVFAKLPSSVIGPEEAVAIDTELTSRVDWEVELAVVIGRRARSVGVADALEHVLGYTIANDVSARDLQFADGQWVRAKSLDTFCPLGPVVVTGDELGDPQALALRTRVNGELVQDSSTAEMIFGVAEIIAHCSRSFTLEPGDVLLTGTPWGCGEFADPPRHLRPGDEMISEIDGIGALRNPVVALSPSAGRAGG